VIESMLLYSSNETEFTDEGLIVTPRNTTRSTGQSMIFIWSDDLKEAIEGAE
jgi:hypothetical protein